MSRTLVKQAIALRTTNLATVPARPPRRHNQPKRRDWTVQLTYIRTYGIRAADLTEVREHLLGWSVNRSGTGSAAFIAVDAPGSNWIIGRCGKCFHAMRSVPGGAIDVASLLDGFGSAREAAEMIRHTDG